MAKIKHAKSGQELTLLPEHVVGRSLAATHRLTPKFVSAQHALLRWTGARWEARDLGSRNGTSVNGVRLTPARPVPLTKGDVVCFGDQTQVWRLEDDSPPNAMAIPLDGGEALCADGGVLAIPSAERPDVMIYAGSDGEWLIERQDEPVTMLDDGQVFEAAGRSWRFCRPEIVARTAALDDARDVRSVELHFAVSRDEEHVHLQATCRDVTVDLGSRTHHYLLLTLARERLADASAGHPESACGWMYQDDLINAVAIPPAQLNIDVFRIRRQFAALDVADPAQIVERRPRAKQLRLGTSRIAITQV